MNVFQIFLFLNTHPDGSFEEWAYDALGLVISHRARNGGVTTTTRDARGMATATTDPLGNVTAHTYHPGGAPASLTDARGNAYSFTYDLLGRKTAMLYPDGSSEQWSYNDSAGLASPRWTHTARDGSTMSCTADARGRDTFCDFSDPLTPDVTSAYDAAGCLVSASSSVSTSLYAYDAANQLLSETTSYSGLAGSRIVGYAYDMDGRRSQLFYPDGTVVDYAHTPRGQLAAITADGPPPLATFTYDPSGLPLSRTLENNTSTAYAYDGAGRLLSVAHSGNGTALRTIAYTLDPNGRRTSREENGDLAIYGYDPTGQLTSVSNSTNATYTYDPVGNRQSVTGAVPGSGTYLADALNRYTAAPGGGAAYDLRGNLVAHAGRTLAYDSRNRLVNATVGGHTITTTYDHRNRAVKRTVDGTATYFVWDDWSLIAELDASGGVLQRYIQGPGIDNIIAKTNSAGTVYYHQDGLGSTVALTDATGANVETYTYDAFGAVRILDPSTLATRPTSLFSNRFTFTGREYLAEVGLYDYRNRAYDPELGRFLQTDPIRFVAQDVNLYRYVYNNPINWNDPLGLKQYSNQTAAARAATKAINHASIANNVEHCGNVCKDDKTGKFFTTGPVTGTIAGCNPGSAPCPSCSKWVAYWHTHGAFTDTNGDGIDDYDSENFSPQDRNYAERNKVDGYLGTPSGQFKHHDHNGKKDYNKKPL